MVAAPLCLFEGLRAEFLCNLELAKADPRLGEIERDDAFDDSVIPFDRDCKSALEIFQSFTEVSNLRIQHPDIVQDPGHRFHVTRVLECIQAVRVRCSGSGKITTHVREYTAILLYHSEQSLFADFFGESRSFTVQTIRFLLIAATLCDDGEAVERVRLTGFVVGPAGFGETVTVTTVSGFGFPPLPEKRPFPAEYVCEEGMEAIGVKVRQSIIV
ncbi:MAG TPA: hypothetical protein VE110_05895 [Gemmatimonadaceae bacterium]|nr:hypothetical protein [Gemmatimonadaceae bacterium]